VCRCLGSGSGNFEIAVVHVAMVGRRVMHGEVIG
jgi:hypothetical protein